MKYLLAWSCALAALLSAIPQSVFAQHRDHYRDHYRGPGRGWGGDIRHFQSHDFNRWRSGSWRHTHHAGRLGWWWVAGGSWYFYPQPVYPYPDPYLPSTVIVQTPPPVVVAPVAPPVVQEPPPQIWYYCEASAGYYPYVPACPGGWKTVPATPASPPQ